MRYKPPVRIGLTLFVAFLVVSVAYGIHNFGLVRSGFTSAAAIQSSKRVEVEVITVFPHGFEPAEITRGAGPFLLAIAYRKGSIETELSLDASGGSKLLNLRTSKGNLNLNEPLDLPPGKYFLKDSQNPGSVCQIIISPNEPR